MRCTAEGTPLPDIEWMICKDIKKYGNHTFPFHLWSECFFLGTKDLKCILLLLLALFFVFVILSWPKSHKLQDRVPNTDLACVCVQACMHAGALLCS